MPHVIRNSAPEFLLPKPFRLPIPFPKMTGNRMPNPFTRSADFFNSAPSAKHGDMLEDIINGLYAARLRPGDLAVDGGAHIGLHTLGMARHVSPGGRVIAVEALTRLATGMLARRINEGGFADTVVVENVALGAEPGQAIFHDVSQAPGYSGLRARDDLPGNLSETIHEVSVKVEPLDALVARNALPGKKVSFIKLDLEGGEFDCLRGARRTLEKDRPLVVFEHGQAKAAALYGYTKDGFFDFFDSVGYTLTTLLQEPMTRETWGTGQSVWYMVATPL